VYACALKAQRDCLAYTRDSVLSAVAGSLTTVKYSTVIMSYQVISIQQTNANESRPHWVTSDVRHVSSRWTGKIKLQLIRRRLHLCNNVGRFMYFIETFSYIRSSSVSWATGRHLTSDKYPSTTESTRSSAIA